MAEPVVRQVLAAGNELGEGPIWSPHHRRLFWIDLYGETLDSFDPASGRHDRVAIPALPGCLCFRGDGTAILAAADGLHAIDVASGRAERFADAPFAQGFRFNDGKTDRQGRLWVGSIALHLTFPDAEQGLGTYYRCTGAEIDAQLPGITIPNGTAFSPDGRTMYRAETFERTIYALDYDPDTGSASRQRIFATVPPELGMPDGATVDDRGGYWVALCFGAENGHIARFTPDGRLDFAIPVPVLAPTMVAFGGDDMATLFVTSGKLEAFAERPVSPLSGGIMAIDTGFRGILETDYRG